MARWFTKCQRIQIENWTVCDVLKHSYNQHLLAMKLKAEKTVVSDWLANLGRSVMRTKLDYKNQRDAADA
jgi:hypothetical protein